MFQGREYLSQLGIYDFRNRYYQPQLGRFLQGDPMGFGGGDVNLFRYCGGDPVNGSDPSGLGWFSNLLGKIFNTEHKGGGTATTERVTVTGSSVNDRTGLTSLGGSGWIDASSPQGMLGFPNLGGSPGAGFDWFGGTSFTFGNNIVQATSFLPSPTIAAQPLPPAPNPATPDGSNLNHTIDVSVPLGAIVIPTSSGPLLIPIGGHIFGTFNQQNITLGVGSGIVTPPGGAVYMEGQPFGQSTGAQLVSQVFAAIPGLPIGAYASGVPFSQGGASFEYGRAVGFGGSISITVDLTIQFANPFGR